VGTRYWENVSKGSYQEVEIGRASGAPLIGDIRGDIGDGTAIDERLSARMDPPRKNIAHLRACLEGAILLIIVVRGPPLPLKRNNND
jgi:hypothetical protein